MKNVNSEFCEHAKEYNSNNIIQQIVSKALIRELDFEPKRILELGCGSGQVFQNIEFPYTFFKGIDFSKKMCELHPKGENITIECLDFDSEAFEKSIKGESYDVVLSSSALQWSKDLKRIVSLIGEISPKIRMVLFTSNTFKTIFEITGQTSPILSTQEIEKAFDTKYKCEYEILKYNLEFEDKKKMFDYIKNSGVGGGNESLSFKEAKNLYKTYPSKYLEFEVIFIKGERKS